MERGEGAAWVVADLDEHRAASAGKAPFLCQEVGCVGEILLRRLVKSFRGSVRNWKGTEKGELGSTL